MNGGKEKIVIATTLFTTTIPTSFSSTSPELSALTSASLAALVCPNNANETEQ